ncbi:MAG TPA: hypothetical protein VGO82_01635 [Enterovirga sp.]|nr:hypothetical protein [Enterovirga sp.]
MTKPVLRLCLAIVVGLTSSAAFAESCRRSAEAPGKRKAADCDPSERLRPYEPEKLRAGRDRGLIDLGNGTEMRVGGSVRMDYDVRR